MADYGKILKRNENNGYTVSLCLLAEFGSSYSQIMQENYKNGYTQVIINSYLMLKIAEDMLRDGWILLSIFIDDPSGAIVIYTDGVRTQYLIDRARGAAALRILRVINNSDKNKIIEAQSFNITEDFFIWLISRFMEGNRIIDEENSLSISRIIGFKGEGSQKQAILSGSGNEVMNLLSSLSFLIEMDVMNEIEVRIVCGSETFEVRFYSKNSQIDILVDNYVGEYIMLPSEERDPRILLNSFINIIPRIMNAYNEEIDNGNWTKNSKREFTLGLADSIKEKLDFLYPSQNGEI